MKAALVVVTLVLASSLAHAQTKMSFDWTMSRGKTTRFVLNLDACPGAPRTATTTVSHAWTIVHPDLPGRQVTVGPTNKCKTPVPIQEEGVYGVTLTSSADSVTKVIVLQEWVIVAIGDSIGSGEGNPDHPLQVDDWIDKLADLDAALANLGQVPHAAQIVNLTSTAITRTNDLIHCLGWNRRVGVFGIVYYTPRICAAELLVGLPVQTTIKLAALNEVIIQINVLAARTVFQHIAFSLELLNPLKALKSAFTTYQNTVQALLDAVALARQISDDVEAGLAAEWLDRRCHRSRTSAQAMAAAELEQLDPRTVVSFIHLSCSGAQILPGLLSGYAGREPPSPHSPIPLPPQVQEAITRVAGREVDAILVSIGGNDARFSDVAKSCTVQNPCSDPQVVHFEEFNFTAICAGVAFIPGMLSQCMAYADSLSQYNSATGAQLFNAGLTTLPARYQQLHDALVDGFPVLASDPGRVLISEYPDGSRDAQGNSCGSGDPLNDFPGMSVDEWTWVGNTMMPALNAAVHAAATNHRWTLVGGIFGDFESHGYCSSNSWFVRLQDSFVVQGDQFGTLHPNAAGHQTMAQRIVASLRPLLYDNGDLLRPRRPHAIVPAEVESVPPEISASATITDGAEYAADTWTRHAVTIQYLCEDLSGTGLASCTADQLFDADGVTPFATGTAADNAGKTAEATFGPIKIDRTNPAIVASATNADGSEYAGNWANEPVTVRYACTDLQSGIAGCTPDQVFAADGVTTRTVGTASDTAGNLAEATVGPIMVDGTAPGIQASAIRSGGSPYVAGSWTNQRVTVQFTCADATSGVPDGACGYGDLWPDAPRSAIVEASNEGVTNLTGIANDSAGNSSRETYGPIMVDLTPPTLEFGVLSPPVNAAGWHRTTVAIDFRSTDNLSGVASMTPAAPLQLIGDGVGVAATVLVTDHAGNSARFTSPAANIDTIAPAITIHGPVEGASFLQHETATSTYSCSDGLSGLDRCSGVVPNGGHVPTGTVGAQVFRVEAIDLAGNVAVSERQYAVITVSDGLMALSGLVEAMNLKQGIANSLDAKLDAVRQAVDAANAGQRQDAVNKLEAFRNAVEAQRGKALTNDQANTLVAEALRIIAVLAQ